MRVRTLSFVDPTESLWRELSSIAEDQGLRLYDAERIQRDGLRVFVDRIAETATPVQVSPPLERVTSEDCFGLCKRLSAFFSVEGERFGLSDGDPVLEVSSPGVNRHLRLPNHFLAAQGQRVKVVFREPREAIGGFVVGELSEVVSDAATVIEEQSQKAVSFRLGEVKRAQVDYRF